MEDMSLESNTFIILLCEATDVTADKGYALAGIPKSLVLNCSLSEFSLE